MDPCCSLYFAVVFVLIVIVMSAESYGRKKKPEADPDENS